MATKIAVPGELEIVLTQHVSPRREHQLFDYEIAFLGACLGVALCRRGSGRLHGEPVTFTILCEDQGNWYVKGATHSSTFYLPDLMEQLTAAEAWLDANAERVQFGWAFK